MVLGIKGLNDGSIYYGIAAGSRGSTRPGGILWTKTRRREPVSSPRLSAAIPTSRATRYRRTQQAFCSVADPKHYEADPDLSFHFDADPGPSFHFDADPEPDPSPHESDAILRPLVDRPSATPFWASKALHSSILSLHRPWIKFDADPDPCESGSATLAFCFFPKVFGSRE